MNSHRIDYLGSDEEIRAKFENYLASFLLSMKYTADPSSIPEAANNSGKKVDYLSDFGSLFVKAWQTTQNYDVWEHDMASTEFPSSVK